MPPYHIFPVQARSTFIRGTQGSITRAKGFICLHVSKSNEIYTGFCSKESKGLYQRVASIETQVSFLSKTSPRTPTSVLRRQIIQGKNPQSWKLRELELWVLLIERGWGSWSSCPFLESAMVSPHLVSWWWGCSLSMYLGLTPPPANMLSLVQPKLIVLLIDRPQALFLKDLTLAKPYVLRLND